MTLKEILVIASDTEPLKVCLEDDMEVIGKDPGTLLTVLNDRILGELVSEITSKQDRLTIWTE